MDGTQDLLARAAQLPEKIAPVVEHCKGIPYNLLRSRELEVIANEGETPVVTVEAHNGRLRARITGGTFRRKRLTDATAKD